MRQKSVWWGVVGIAVLLLAGCGGGSDGGAPTATATTTATTTALVPKADYRFQNTLASSVGTAPDLVNIGGDINTFGTSTVDGQSRTVLNFPTSNGVSLATTTGVIANDTYSIVALFSFAEIGGYRRILDFKNSTSDDGLYFYNGTLWFYPVTATSTNPIATSTFVQVVLTRDVAKNVVGYVDGVQIISLTDTNDVGVVDINNTLRVFKDDGGESSSGSVARIRLYDSVLSASEVAGLNRLP